MHCLRVPAAAGARHAVARRAAQRQQRRTRCAAPGGAAPAPAAAPAAGAPAAVPAYEQPAHERPAQEPIFYSAYPLDRAAELRQDAAKQEQLLRDPRARLLPISGSRALVAPYPAQKQGGEQQQRQQQQQGHEGQQQAAEDPGPTLAPAWVTPASEAAGTLDPGVPPLFLGLDDAGAPSFAGQVARAAADALPESLPGSRRARAAGAGAWGAGDAGSGACGAA
jgi:hypothetical protein